MSVFLTALSAFVYAAFVFVKTLLLGDPVPGFPTLIVVISFLGGLQLMAIGVLGEYVGRLFVEAKNRPLYLVEELHPPAQAPRTSWSRGVVESIAHESPARPIAALLWIAIAAAFAARFVLLGAFPLMDPTESRYAEIARQMFVLGDWITPWIAPGEPFWGKPPFSFWMTAGSFQLFGVSDFAARLPHWVGGGLVAWLAWSWLAVAIAARGATRRRVARGFAALLRVGGRGHDGHGARDRPHGGDARLLARAARTAGAPRPRTVPDVRGLCGRPPGERACRA